MPPKKQAAAKAASTKTAAQKAQSSKAATAKTVNVKSTKKASPPTKASPKPTGPKTKLANGIASAETAASKSKASRSRSASKQADVPESQDTDSSATTAKAAPAKKAARKAASEAPEAKPAGSKKRKNEEATSPGPDSKKRKAGDGAAPAVAKKPKAAKQKTIINKAPTQVLHVYSFGTGDTAGELGLGPSVRIVKRPRLNPFLPADKVGVVQVACGGMHCAALTKKNEIYTWGVNDHGALGRQTEWEGGMRDMDAQDTDSDDAEMNPHESKPTAIDSNLFPEGTVFTQVACSDSSTFALTDEGTVWGWGTFKSSEGVIGFSQDEHIQTKPMPISNLKKVTKIVCGGNHVLALNASGAVFAWGSGEKNQLGRRIVERTRLNGLVPREFGLPKGITDIAAGSYHNFAVHGKSGKVYAWGLNNFGQTGIVQGAGEDDAVILHPKVIDSLTAKSGSSSSSSTVTALDGGEHHSIAVLANGGCLTWGRVDGFQCGIPLEDLPSASTVKDERGNIRILTVPTRVPGFDAVAAGCGARHSIAVATDGKAWSWGTNNTFQCGQGNDEDVEEATWIDNTALRGKKVCWAGASAQFSNVAAVADDVEMVNGV
ncbi:MAG: hypothetical protein Q9227_005469 [Pyrenula ochraceoflavens]